MSKKWHLLISVMISLVAFIWACGGTPFHKDSTLNNNWGRSYETAKYNQIINPEAGKNLEPILIMQLKELCHKIAYGMISEIGGNIANPEPSNVDSN